MPPRPYLDDTCDACKAPLDAGFAVHGYEIICSACDDSRALTAGEVRHERKETPMTNTELRAQITAVVTSLVANQTPFTAWDVTKLVRKEWAGPKQGVAHPKVKAYVRSLFEMDDMEGYARTRVQVGECQEDAILYHPEGGDTMDHPAVKEAKKAEEAHDRENGELIDFHFEISADELDAAEAAARSVIDLALPESRRSAAEKEIGLVDLMFTGWGWDLDQTPDGNVASILESPDQCSIGLDLEEQEPLFLAIAPYVTEGSYLTMRFGETVIRWDFVDNTLVAQEGDTNTKWISPLVQREQADAAPSSDAPASDAPAWAVTPNND